MPLCAFPETFELRELKKGFFPHLFNTPANQNYHGPLPDAKHYMPDGMTLSTRQEFDTWYAEQMAHQTSTGTLFHFEEELKTYCRSDVRPLKEGCLSFMREFQWLRRAMGISVCIASLGTPLHPSPSWGGEAALTILRSRWNGCCGRSTGCKPKPGRTCRRTKANNTI